MEGPEGRLTRKSPASANTGTSRRAGRRSLAAALDGLIQKYGRLAFWGVGGFLSDRVDPQWLNRPDIFLIDTEKKAAGYGGLAIDDPEVIRLRDIRCVIISVTPGSSAYLEIADRLGRDFFTVEIRGLHQIAGLSEADPALDQADWPVVGPALHDGLGNRLLIGREECPVCASPYAVPVRYVFSTDLTRRVLLRHCLECASYWTAPHLIGDRIPPEKKICSSVNTLDYHRNVAERNRDLSKALLADLSGIAGFSSVLEIGCGPGTLLSVAAEAGCRVLGFDVSLEAVEMGRRLYGLPLRAEQWTSDAVREKYDLTVCISTLEHLVEPRPLIRELAVFARTMKSLLFVSVPVFRDVNLMDLMSADPRDDQSILKWPLGHYTLFSRKALELVFGGYGGRIRWLERPNGWSGIFCDFRSLFDESNQ